MQHFDPHELFQTLFTLYNQQLFSNLLPNCSFHFANTNKARGFVNPVDSQPYYLMVFNPSILNQTPSQIHTRLVHEMTHFIQAREGTQPVAAYQPASIYHNKDWADRMENLGLMPSSTGLPGGKKTGPHVSQYIIEGGSFDIVYSEFLQNEQKLISYKDDTNIELHSANVNKSPIVHPNG